VDPAFPPLSTSLSRRGIDSRAIPETAWKRPEDYLPVQLHSKIALFRDGVDPNDIDQGQLGDCWLLCAIAALAEFPSKVEDIFCHPVSAEAARREKTIGVYRVTLNKHGWWHVVAVDDYLPVVGQKPCFAKCIEDPSELWVSILEKAYAKFHGSYASIAGGDSLQALQDLTGYPVFRFDDAWQAAMNNPSDAIALFSKLLVYDESNFLISLNTPGFDTAAYNSDRAGNNSKSTEERYRQAGLTLGHAYTALEVRYIPRHNLRLLKIRNPWGTGQEWTGTWGDDDSAWSQYPDVAAELGYVKANDGTFWMSFDDVLSYFDGGGVCFTKFNWHDYRVKGRFQNGFPNLVLEVTVTKPVCAYAVLSQKDKRGLSSSDPDATYSALMLSVSKQFSPPSSANVSSQGRQKIHLNSTANTEEPSEQFTFNYSRDFGLKYEFRPEESPYYIIPRIYDAGGTKDYTLGLIADTQAGTAALKVAFKCLPKTCRVFHNFPVFQTEGIVDTEAEFQWNPEVGAPRTSKGSCFKAAL
jgi:hypothetical protein